MKKSTILHLDRVNQLFYQQTAADFAASRWKEWPGWKKLIPFFTEQKQPYTVLDIGCGGGRLARFLHKNLSEQIVKYIGVDRDQELLQISQKFAPAKSPHWQAQFQSIDLVKSLLNNTLVSQLQQSTCEPPQIITLFAVTHHIPSLKLRQQLLVTLADLLPPNGLLLVSFWQFLNAAKQREHLVDPTVINLNPIDWEENDFILDWRSSDISAYRYCHATNNAEEIELLKATNLTVVDEFFADGVTRNMNHYLVLKKPG